MFVPCEDSLLGQASANPVSTVPAGINRENILINIHELGEAIQQGDVQKSANLAKMLADEGVQLQLKPTNQGLKEEQFKYVKNSYLCPLCATGCFHH